MTKAERYRRCEESYQLELARSASHIASCLTAESTTRCIEEVLQAFVRDRGAEDLAIFRKVLADRLEARRCARAAQLVNEWKPVARASNVANAASAANATQSAADDARRRDNANA
jgi:hypothetical protein